MVCCTPLPFHVLWLSCRPQLSQQTYRSVAGVAHVDQDVAADGYDLQDGVDDDYDDKISVMNSCTMIVDMI